MAVFSVVCMLLYKMAARFVKAVDDATMEVADYTVVVKGLPTETTPQEVCSSSSCWLHHHQLAADMLSAS